MQSKISLGEVKASTLLEVVVAMVHICCATGLYTNVLHSSPSLKQQYICGMAESSVSFQKEVKPFEDYSDLLVIHVAAIGHGLYSNITEVDYRINTFIKQKLSFVKRFIAFVKYFLL